MSLKSMMTKLAIAFVAAKGAQAFTRAGGMEGVKRKLAEQKGSGQGLGGLLGGSSGSGSGGGLGGMLGQLGLGGSGGAAGGMAAGGIGGILGGLAGGSAPGETGGDSTRMQGLLDSTAKPDVPEEAEAGLVIRAMVMAAKADGEIDETERRALWEVLGDSEAADQAFVEAAMNAPVDVEALARDVPAGLELEIYTASVMAIEPDNRAEAQYLHALAERLGLERDTVNEVHTAQGKAPLYST
ncbi:DUF533 domain-containing protein [Oceaniglobus trochenteri]|uniref:DUF533 domain-containing protein n=1 Tax=Oceaniglobus trochenteri TaxID=2763260 RepID=UPI001CFF75FE|nr:DUF533 domain-containing protein [Oceaniglobus trochenteri]